MHQQLASARTGRKPLRIFLSAALLAGVATLSPVSPLSGGSASAVDVFGAPQDLSAAGAVTTLPQVSADSNGNAVAVWLRQTVADATDPTICDPLDLCVVDARTFNKSTSTWSPVTTLSSPTLAARQADVVISPTGGAMAIWRSTNNTTNQDTIQASVLTGTTWAAPFDASVNTGSPRGPQLSVSAAGEYTVVWYRSTFVESRQYHGTTWDAVVPLNLPAETAELSRVVSSASGIVTALWQGTIGAQTFVRAARFNGTAWSAAASVTPTGVTLVPDADPTTTGPLETLAPQLAVDPNGNATAVWQQSDGTNTRILTSRSANGTTWSVPETLSAANGNAQNARVDADAAGNVTALWRRTDTGGFSVIQSAHYSILSHTWGPVVDLSTTGRQAQSQRLAVDDQGNVTAVWRRNNSDGNSIIQSARYSPLTNQWAAARDLSAPGANAITPATDVDQAGNVIVVWSRNNTIQVSTSTNIPGFVSVTPVRVFDTRPEFPDGLRVVSKIKVGGTYELTVKVSGLMNGTTPVTPATVSAVSLNVTVVDPNADGFVTVYPCADRSEVSNVNFLKGQTVANAVIAPVTADGNICFFSNTPTHILSDINGYFPVGSGYTAVSPKRVLDTRPGQSSNALLSGVKTKIGGTTELVVPMTGLGLNTVTPATGVSAVAINVTVSNPVDAGFVTVYPCGASPRPTVSSVNYLIGQTVANQVIAPLAANGTICLFSNAMTDVIVDISGWFPTESTYAPAATPGRVFDTRADQPDGLRAVTKAKIGGTTELKVHMSNLTDITPPLGVGAVALNITVTNPIGPGFVTVYPCGDRPTVSSINFVAGQTVANAVIAPLSPTGDLCFFSNLNTDLIVDINGFFAA